MSTLTLKQVPAELIAQLRRDAQRQRRSVNQHAIFLLERAVGSARPSFGEALDRFAQDAGPPEPGLADELDGLRARDEGRKVDL